MGTGIYLQSDFIEKYDNYLHDPMGKYRWKRLSRGGMNRRRLLSFLDEHSKDQIWNRVVPHGIVKDLYKRFKETNEWEKLGISSSYLNYIVYLDEKSHRGEGKILVDIEEAIKKYPDYYASVYLENECSDFSISERLLYIGNIVFKLTYISITDNWRSNCGKVIVKYISKNEVDKKDLLNYPIYSIDRIWVKMEKDSGSIPFLLDFNIAPGIPEEVFIEGNDEPVDFYNDIISAKNVAELIENRFKETLLC